MFPSNILIYALMMDKSIYCLYCTTVVHNQSQHATSFDHKLIISVYVPRWAPLSQMYEKSLAVFHFLCTHGNEERRPQTTLAGGPIPTFSLLSPPPPEKFQVPKISNPTWHILIRWKHSRACRTSPACSPGRREPATWRPLVGHDRETAGPASPSGPICSFV